MSSSDGQLSFVVERVSSWEERNDNNHFLESPYGVLHMEGGCCIQVERWFWDRLLESTKRSISQIVQKSSSQLRLVDHIDPASTRDLDDTLFNDLYQAYVRQYDYDTYYSRISDKMFYLPTVLPITQRDRRLLHEMCQLHSAGKCDRQLLDFYGEEGPCSFHANCRSLFGEGGRFFVKLNCYSSKHDYGVLPVDSIHELILHLTRGRKFQAAYERPDKVRFTLSLALVLIPWISDIKERDEFRIFVRDRQVVAISQQCWWQDHQFCDSSIEAFVRAIDECCKCVCPNLPFPDAVIDVFLRNGVCYIIECNPYGSFSSSGAALFSWRVDRKIIGREFANQHPANIVVRVLSEPADE